MRVIGITGGISTGKSTFTQNLRELLPEAKFFDADAMARELTATDGEVKAEVRAEFGDAVFTETRELNRGALRAIVFGEPGKRRALENILHPRVRQRWSSEAKQPTHPLFFADIPLLYETAGDTLCDAVAVVACSDQIQLMRLRKRTGMAEEEARAIIAAQLPLAEKMRRADHVVWNNGPREVLAQQARFLAELWRKP